jgi:hypothetical protein
VRGTARTSLGLLAAAVTTSCQLVSLSNESSCIVSPVPVEEIDASLSIRQQVRMTVNEEIHGMETVARREAESLAFVGFTPFGTRSFAIEQNGTRVTRDDRIAKHLGQHPLFLFDALHRTRVIGADLAPLENGDRSWSREGEQITEHWENGALRERTYSRAGFESPGVVINYAPSVSARPGPAPTTIHIRNEWCGYHAQILDISEAGR